MCCILRISRQNAYMIFFSLNIGEYLLAIQMQHKCNMYATLIARLVSDARIAKEAYYKRYSDTIIKHSVTEISRRMVLIVLRISMNYPASSFFLPLVLIKKTLYTIGCRTMPSFCLMTFS